MPENHPKKSNTPTQAIAINRSASYEYHIEKRFVAGLVLQGWEVKALRAHRAQLKESYVAFKQTEAFLYHAHFSPLPTVSRHTAPDPKRARKLLLTRRELDTLQGSVQRKGYTMVPLRLFWQHGLTKLEFCLAKGKKLFDKRAAEKTRDFERQKQRLLRL